MAKFCQRCVIRKRLLARTSLWQKALTVSELTEVVLRAVVKCCRHDWQIDCTLKWQMVDHQYELDFTAKLHSVSQSGCGYWNKLVLCRNTLIGCSSINISAPMSRQYHRHFLTLRGIRLRINRVTSWNCCRYTFHFETKHAKRNGRRSDFHNIDILIIDWKRRKISR